MTEIYALTGRRGHGKDTFARLVQEYTPTFTTASFARALKRGAMRIWGLSKYQVEDPVGKESPLTTSCVMDDFIPQMSAETQLEIQPRGLVAYTPRQILQFYGTEYVRSVRDSYWVDTLLDRIRGIDRVMITDCRFPNELTALHQISARAIQILRIDAPRPDKEHLSETALDGVPADLVVGAVTDDLSLVRRIAFHIACGRWGLACALDYRRRGRTVEDEFASSRANPAYVENLNALYAFQSYYGDV